MSFRQIYPAPPRFFLYPFCQHCTPIFQNAEAILDPDPQYTCSSCGWSYATKRPILSVASDVQSGSALRSLSLEMWTGGILIQPGTCMAIPLSAISVSSYPHTIAWSQVVLLARAAILVLLWRGLQRNHDALETTGHCCGSGLLL